MISTFGWFGYDIPMKDSFVQIKDAGFDGVMLWWSEDFGRHDYRDTPAQARDAGLFVENIHTPFEGINDIWLDNLAGEAWLERFLGIVGDCADYELPTAVVHTSSGENPPPFGEVGLNRFKKIVDKAEKYGVNIAFENLRRHGHLDYVLRNIDSPKAGLCYDNGHHNYFTPDVDLLGLYGSRLMALHLHDNDGTDDQHRLPFEGTTDWPSVMKGIVASGYQGSIALEAQNVGYEALPPDEFLRLAYERAVRLECLMRG